MSGELKLTDAQKQATTQLGRNLSLSAGAGCGKTFVLARRFTELLWSAGDETNPLAELLAVTFTDKAALEMAQRVRRFLLERAESATGDEDRRKLMAWVNQLPEARISTIHSFCASLLRAHAVEAGIDPNFAVCSDDLQAGRLLTRAAEDSILAAIQDRWEGLGGVLMGMSLSTATQAVERLVQDRLRWSPDRFASAEQILQRWREQLLVDRAAAMDALGDDPEFVDRTAALARIQCLDPDDKLLGSYTAVRQACEAILARQPGETAIPPGAHDAAKASLIGGAGKAWPVPVAEVKEHIKALRDKFQQIQPLLQDLGETDEAAANALHGLVRLAVEAEKRYAQQKRRRGLLDFTDLLAHARQLLRERPDVRATAGRAIRQLLLDEAQDTSAAQLELLSLVLFGQARPEEMPDGRLFVVGDSKQSIYRFREAQLEVFQDLRDRIGSHRRVPLDLSFRTHRAGVAFVNHLFSRLMGDGYEPLRAHRQQTPPEPSVEFLLARDAQGQVIPASPRYGGGAGPATAAQALTVAQRIEELVDGSTRRVWDESAERWRPAFYGDIAILFSRMTNTLPYERRLAERGIPYYVVGGTGFFRQQEVYDLLNVLRAVENPYDDIALIGVLRSPMVALDDNDLARIAAQAAPPYTESLEKVDLWASADPEACNRLRRMRELLQRWGARKDAVAIDALCEQILDATGYEAVLLSQFEGARRAGNVRRLVQLARDASAGGASLAEFIAQMDEQIADSSRYEQAAVAGEAQNVVRLMTIHKAKGLEFPIVVLPDLNAGKQAPRGPLLHRQDWGWVCSKAPADPEDESAGESDLSDEAKPVSWQAACEAEKRDEHREDIRKLYVAITRHADHAVFVAADMRAKAGQTLNPSGSTAAMLDEALGLVAAVDGEAGQIAYEDSSGQYVAIVRTVTPTARRVNRAQPAGASILRAAGTAVDVCRGVLDRAGDGAAPRLLGPLPPETGRVEIPVTGLTLFEQDREGFRREYELRLPRRSAQGPAKPDGPSGPLDPATLGTLLHLCMENLDVHAPASAAALVHAAAGEMGLSDVPGLDTVADEFEPMLEAFLASDLAETIRSARQVYRELDFLMEAGPALLRGQIDLLVEDAEGEWYVVDYKSDRVEPSDLGAKARRYELQMLIYAEAARRHFGKAPAEASLYFLRPGRTCTLATDADRLADLAVRVAELARKLIQSRRDPAGPTASC